MTYAPKYTDATSVYTKTGLVVGDKDVTANDNQLIAEAESELEMVTGRKFTSSSSVTEWLIGPKLDVLGYSGTPATTINLSNYPLLTITEFKTYYYDDSVENTYATLSSGTDTTDYWCNQMEDPLTNTVYMTGEIQLKTKSFTPENRIKVSYTYGYTTVPIQIKNLATCLAGIRLWIAFLGGNYNRLNSYSVPQQTVDKGDFYSRGDQMIVSLTEEANRLLDRIGRKTRVLAFSSGTTR